MEMIAYTNNNDTTVADKVNTLTYIGTYQLTPYNIVDIERPTFILDYAPQLVNCNYIKVAELNRYYFVTGAVNKGSQIIFECLSDPLTSFLTELQNCDITVLRSASAGSPTMYEDTKLPVYPSKNNITSIVMSHSAAPLSGDLSVSATNCYLLTVLGGQPTVQGG